MELIRRKILIEDLISRQPGVNYGTMASTIYVNLMITQNMDDMGMFTDADYTPLNGVMYNYEIDTINATFSATTSVSTDIPLTVEDYFSTINPVITGYTDSKITSYQSYNRITPYNTSFIPNSGEYINYKGETIDGISKITSLIGPTGYTVDGNNDTYLGTENQNGGILYNDYNSIRIVRKQDVINGSVRIPLSTFKIKSEGWNETNISLSALTKEEIYLGIISPPEVKSDVFIERGNTSVLEPHLKLSEIESIDHLEIYGNGYYKLIK
jgi:hypothetical protein